MVEVPEVRADASSSRVHSFPEVGKEPGHLHDRRRKMVVLISAAQPPKSAPPFF
jgi:hypothetical protein